MDFKTHLLNYYENDIVEELLASLDKEDFHAVLLNPSKMNEELLFSLFGNLEKHPFVNNAYYYDKNKLPLGKNVYFDAGGYYLQEPSAMIVASLLPIRENDLILDMCAAPGGKTCQLGFRYPNNLIISNDLSYQRAQILSSNIERFGFDNVIVTAMDPKKFPSRFKGLFNAIVLDVPCSGSGMFRKTSEMKDDWTYEKVLKCASIQKELIELASSYLSNDGYMIYSTCSFSYEEDEAIILDFLKNHQEFEIINLNTSNAFYSHETLKESIHLFPSKFNGEGHFMALLHKIGVSSKKEIKIKQTKNKFEKLLKDFPISQYEIINRNDLLYGLRFPFNYDNLTILRLGLELGTIQKDRFIPSLALARSLTWNKDIALNEEQKNKYLHGEVLNVDQKYNGYYTVSYQGLTLGFVKVSNGIAKNHYPKGLRR